jgi:cullin 1
LFTLIVLLFYFYRIKTERAIEEECTRVQNYLNPDTQPKLLRVIEEVILEKRSTELLEKDGSGCRVLLINDMSNDLTRMFRLFSRVPNGLEPMATIVKQHIADLGNDKIDQRVLRLESEKESNEDPQFVKDLLSIHDRFKFVIDNHFESNTLFQKSLKDAFVEVVNRNLGKYKTADLMSSFCDRILKTGSIEKLNDTEIEDFLEKIVQMFSYLTDKDLFAEIYRNQLAKRLLSQRSASNDMERLMIGKLKNRCGAQFTSKMEGM